MRLGTWSLLLVSWLVQGVSHAEAAPIRIDYTDITVRTTEDFSGFLSVARDPVIDNRRIFSPEKLEANGFTVSAGPSLVDNPLRAPQLILGDNGGGARLCGSRNSDDVCVAPDGGYPAIIFTDFDLGTTEFGIQVSRVRALAGDNSLEFTVVGNSGTERFIQRGTILQAGGKSTRLGFRDTEGLVSVSVVNLDAVSGVGTRFFGYFYDDVVTGYDAPAPVPDGDAAVVPLPASGLMILAAVSALGAIGTRRARNGRSAGILG